MPPLMLTPDEIEAAVLGAQLVARLPDPLLAGAARDLIAKIAAVVPERLRPFIAAPSVAAKPAEAPPDGAIAMGPLRSAIRQGRKLRLRYRAETGPATERTVWPVLLGYAETRSLLIAWCELRCDFRTDRILDLAVLDEAYPARRSDLRHPWERWRETERRARAAS